MARENSLGAIRVGPSWENRTQMGKPRWESAHLGDRSVWRAPTWETAQMGENPHGRGGQMGKSAHMGKMNPDGKKWTQSGKINPDGKK